ncbi:unnamed protein product [Triticum turgidum subsp. durum]|uniref:Pectinesterase n=1 Tax=Triticum turgidum subsp. durum TaxID=4567 RepID=A0A9R0RVP3_TRITD|nr:unnamed protein product [Triticum turgidum subsp. durum]
MPPPLRILTLLLLIHLPFALSSRHHHKALAPPPRKAPPPTANYAAPLPVLLACNYASRRVPGERIEVPPMQPADTKKKLSKKEKRCEVNVNLTTAATNCLTALSLSSHRLEPPPSPSALMPASASLLHLYDCWSAYKYVNFSRTIYDAMAYLNDTITVNSNYISMLAALKRYGDDTSVWAPPQTERDGYWPSPAASGADVDALGVPKGLPAVAAAPDNGGKRFVVYVKAGVYKETVSVPWEKTNLVLVGDGMGKTVITGDLNADTPGVSTFNTATVGVLADGFMARDLTIANTAGPDAHQAVAFRSTGDRTIERMVEEEPMCLSGGGGRGGMEEVDMGVDAKSSS